MRIVGSQIADACRSIRYARGNAQAPKEGLVPLQPLIWPQPGVGQALGRDTRMPMELEAPSPMIAKAPPVPRCRGGGGAMLEEA